MATEEPPQTRVILIDDVVCIIAMLDADVFTCTEGMDVVSSSRRCGRTEMQLSYIIAECMTANDPETETYRPDHRLLSKHLRGPIRSKGIRYVNKIRHVTRSAI